MMESHGWSVEEVRRQLAVEGGLAGLSGVAGGDVRDIEAAAGNGDAQAAVALEAFTYQVRKTIGAYAAAMGGLDAVAFTGAAWVGSHAVVGAGVVIAGPTTTVGVPGGVQAGDAPDDRQAPATHDESWPVQVGSPGPVHARKQNEPVEVLTHLPFAGHVVWSFGLHAAVQRPPGNSGFGSPTQISPATAVHAPAVQALPRSALAALPCGGQLAAGTQAPRPAQQV